ncbi:hypothetical protein ACMA5K_33980 [Bradyrhizobium diazoefficiens]|uniref:hypothetical protein n=1 Tax=Bradyrhizobium diazoefficiens TaxID=1355477 RepID=UPI0015B6E0BB|nr:hypothetical protein [Bradyrhizobium diazoefficiens]QLD45629.1 hypothetical protein HUW42_33640 [Bradyrhizobium diazoefficiens]
MTVLSIQGQANAAVVLKELLQEHGLPSLTPEGVDALSARFSTGLVLGHGVVSHNGKPLIDELRALFADAESKRLFVLQGHDQAHDRPAGNLTASMMAEVAANRKPGRMPDDWQAVRGRYAADSTTAKHMAEIEASRRAGR